MLWTEEVDVAMPPAMVEAVKEEVEDEEVELMQEEAQVPGEGTASGPAKKRRSGQKVSCFDIRTYFSGQPAVRSEVSVPQLQEPDEGVAAAPENGESRRNKQKLMASAFRLDPRSLQEVDEDGLQAVEQKLGTTKDDVSLEKAVVVKASKLEDLQQVTPLLVASLPLLEHGERIFATLPSQWFDVTERNDSIGTRCLFASRRHEHSIFQPLCPEQLLKVPHQATRWQPLNSVSAQQMAAAVAMDPKDAWTIQIHPEQKAMRVLVRPGTLLHRLARRGTALPQGTFTWRVRDATDPAQGEDDEAQGGPQLHDRAAVAVQLGEFSILSNVQDAAHTQPEGFEEFPLRREQLRSLGWMVNQERHRREPFSTELRDSVPCPDAPHWRLEASLRCEYLDVKGGILADAIGYGKTACTIGLIDCTKSDALPRVLPAFQGFIPSRATLVLAPTNLHAQWLSEIKKFTGEKLQVLSVPTCAQLKRLTLKELVEADVVVATYRLFYSSPYLKRLCELAQTRHPGFTWPRQSSGQGAHGSQSVEWARAYRKAFEALPCWAAQLRGLNAPGEENADGAQWPEGEGQGRRKRTSKSRRKSGQSVAPSAPVTQDSQAAGEKRKRLNGKQAVPSVAAPMPTVIDGDSVQNWPDAALGAQFVPLETFWWRRVVCDEFHELLSRYPPAQVAVELFHGDFKWGLSGTPPCQTLAQIRKAAGFFGVQLPLSEAATATSSGTEAPRRVAQEWLDYFVRRNTAELPALEEAEEILAVRQTPKERALYLALTEQHQRQAGETQEDAVAMPAELKEMGHTTGGLLKLCSHFCASGAVDAITAEDECERQLAIRKEQVATVKSDAATLAKKAAELAQIVRHFEPQYGRVASAATLSALCRENRTMTAARLRFLSGAAGKGSKAELLKQLFEAANEAQEAAKEQALQADFDPKAKKTAKDIPLSKKYIWPELEVASVDFSGAAASSSGRQLVLQAVRDALSGLCADPPKKSMKLRSSLKMPKWPGQEEPGSKEYQQLEDENWAWLAEPENAEKLRKVLRTWKADIERYADRLLQVQGEAGEKLQNLSSFHDSLQASQIPGPEVDLEPRLPKFAKYGSKIEVLVRHVQKLQQQDPGCKMICFVQWEDLKQKISDALTEFEVDHLTLHGSVWNRRAVLTQFQYEDDCPKMLLLSLEESASGTNLTAANHVLIVHPMEASTKEEAVAFEMQAVGRVRRPGQLKKIYIWRCVTVGTIEQVITEEHQKELWERQSAKILVSQPEQSQPLNDSDVEEEEEAEAPAATSHLATQVYQEVPLGTEEMSTQRYIDADGNASQACDMPPPPLPKRARLEPLNTVKEEVKEVVMDTDPVLPKGIEEDDTIPYEGFGGSLGPDMDMTQPYESMC